MIGVKVQVFDTPDAIHYFQLVAQRGAVKLESMGYKHSNGNITPKLKAHYNMPRNATYAQVIAKLEEELTQLGWTPNV
jgi:hypothetical protein